MTRKEVIDRYNLWWDNQADDLTIGVGFYTPDVDWDKLPNQKNINDYTAEQFAKNIVKFNSNVVYEGDTLPYYNMDCFGPGVLSAYMGARVDNSTGDIWFRTDGVDLDKLKWEVDYQNQYLTKLIDICDYVYDEVEDEIIIGMTDLGGIIDVLSTFREGENMFFDMMDEPDSVKDAIRQITNRWHEVYDYLNERVYSRLGVYSNWARVFSDVPNYSIQADAVAMLGPNHFDEFVYESLVEQCRRIPRTLYHLDGENAVIHLDKLLGIDDLNAIQWISSPQYSMYTDLAMDIYKRTLEAGKSVQLKYGDIYDVAKTIDKLGTTKNVATMFNYYPIEKYNEIMRVYHSIK